MKKNPTIVQIFLPIDKPNYPIISLGLLNLKKYDKTANETIQKIKYYLVPV